MKQRHIIRKADEIRQFARINVNVLQESFLPYEVEAREKYLRRYLGDALEDELLTLYESETYPEWADEDDSKELLDRLLYMVQGTVVKFTLYIATPHLDLHLSEQGYTVLMNTNSTPASEARVRNARQAYLDQGYTLLEGLLKFLEKHHGDLGDYDESGALLFAHKTLVRNCDEYERYVRIDGSRLLFINEVVPEMENFEEMEIKPIIGGKLLELLRKEKGEDKVSANNEELLDAVVRATCNSVGAIITNDGDNAKKKERLLFYGKHYLARIKQILDATPAKFPLYVSSVNYVNPHEMEHFDNSDDDSKIFVFGHPS